MCAVAQIIRRVIGLNEHHLGRPWFATLPLPRTSMPQEGTVSPSSTTPLARGAITNHDEIVVTLIEPRDGTPPLVQVHWPPRATTTTAASYPGIAATIVRLIAYSATALARIKAHGR
jgi:hypothetical protein